MLGNSVLRINTIGSIQILDRITVASKKSESDLLADFSKLEEIKWSRRWQLNRGIR